MKILDATAGNRAVWFDKHYRDAVFIDVRDSVGHGENTPMDLRHTTFADGEFDLVVFDPPHMNVGPNSQMAKTYGHWSTQEILDLCREAFVEFRRVLKPDGMVAFKWNDHDIRLDRVMPPTSLFEPLVGVPTAMRTLHSSVTYWCLLRRSP